MNGGPGFPFTNAVSLVVNCESQEEFDHFRETLAASRTGMADEASGTRGACGWLDLVFNQSAPVAYH